MTFTGYTLEELQNKKDNNVDKMLSYIDLLIDGGFEKDKYDLSRPWVGSSNQRYIFLSDKFSMDELKQYKNKIEVRLSKDGRLDINGMGNFNELEKEFCLQLGKSSVK